MSNAGRTRSSRWRSESRTRANAPPASHTRVALCWSVLDLAQPRVREARKDLLNLDFCGVSWSLGKVSSHAEDVQDTEQFITADVAHPPLLVGCGQQRLIRISALHD